MRDCGGDREKVISLKEVIRQLVSLEEGERVIITTESVEAIKVKAKNQTVYVYFLPENAQVF